jgi:GDP-D-mannose 3', 5'-epimerase
MRALVAGGGGFIGGHLAKRLIEDGHEVTVADRKPYFKWDQVPSSYDARRLDQFDLSDDCAARMACVTIDDVYMLAADMGGMGFIENNKLDCMLSVLTSTHMLRAAEEQGVQRYFYSSSACVYNASKQVDTDVTALKEEDAYPADAEDGYGWEKLFTERMCRHFTEDRGLYTRVARFHNVYGPNGTWDGGREKAPAAICRKVIEAKLSGNHTIDIWGDGEQTRSFMYVDDCVEGILRIMNCNTGDPLNLGSSELVSINQLVSIVEDIAGINLMRTHDLTAPQGVRGRNSDNTRLVEETGWEPSISLREGLERTYAWIYDEMTR